MGSDHASIGIRQQQVGEHQWGTDIPSMMNIRETVQRFLLGYQHPDSDGGGHNPGLLEGGRISWRYYPDYPGGNIDYNDPKWDMHTLAQLVQYSGPGDTSDDPGKANYGPWEPGALDLYKQLKDC